jgi:hypothetical protein
MGNDQNSGFDSFLAFTIGELIIILTLWVILAVVAYVVAPDDRRWTFLGLTLLLLGPSTSMPSPRLLI